MGVCNSLIKNRLISNKKLFSSKELKRINKTHEKVYLIGLMDGKKIYN